MVSKFKVVIFAMLLPTLLNQMLLSARAESSEATNGDSLFTDVEGAPTDLAEMKTYGPYKEVLVDKSAIKFEIWWKVRIEDDDGDDLQGEIELKTFVKSHHGVNWIGFGFTPDGEIANADWFIVWKSHRGKFIYKVSHCCFAVTCL